MPNMLMEKNGEIAPERMKRLSQSKLIALFDYILCNQRSRSSTESAKTRPGADCGSDHELLIAKFRLKLKKAGKTTRPFRYDLNQIPYNYTVEVNSLLLSFTEGKFHPPLLSTSGPLHLLCPLFLQTVSRHTLYLWQLPHPPPFVSMSSLLLS